MWWKRVVVGVLIVGLVVSYSQQQVFAIGGVADVVHDPLAFFQMLLQGLQFVEMIEHQINQYNEMVLQTTKWVQDLEHITAILPDAFHSIVNSAVELFHNAKGLAHTVREFEPHFDIMYADFGAPERFFTVEQHIAMQQQWNMQVFDANKTAGKLESNHEQITMTQETVTQLLDASDAATGSVSVGQAGNRINAATTQTLLRIEALMAAEGRARLSKDMLEAGLRDAAVVNGEWAMYNFKEMLPERDGVKIEGYETLPTIPR